MTTADAPGQAEEFVLRFARAGHDAGYPTNDLEHRVRAVARALGLEHTEISATPTVVEVTLGALPYQRGSTLRVRPATVGLDAIARLDGLVQRVIDRELDAAGALEALTAVEATRRERPWPILLAAYALAGAALTPLLGGGANEVGAAAAVGLVVGAVALRATRTAFVEPVLAPVAAIAASVGAAAIDAVGVPIATDVVTLAALVTFLPGMTLTIGMQELATEHLQSGVANTASALMQLLGLVFGVGVGRSIAHAWFGNVGQPLPDAGFTGMHVIGAAAAALAFTVTLRAGLRETPTMCAATVLALTANELGTRVVGATAAVFVAALTVGIVGGMVASRRRVTPLVFIVPGVLVLVPGSAGFHSILQLLDHETLSGITAGFDTFVSAMSIAYGLIVSTVLLPRRFTRPTPSRPPAAHP